MAVEKASFPLGARTPVIQNFIKTVKDPNLEQRQRGSLFVILEMKFLLSLCLWALITTLKDLMGIFLYLF